MARVTMAEVQEIIDIDSSITNIDAFITAANLLVTQVFSGDTTVSASMLKEIERNIAAHFVCMRDPRTTEEWNDDIKVKYSGKYGMGLNSTPYGQTAIALDLTGKLGNLSKKRASLGMVDYSESLTS